MRLAALWAWVVSFAIVVNAGYAIELDEIYFGAGDPKAAGSAKDAVFTWLHQDLGLFLFPTLVLVMLAVELVVARRRQGAIGWTMLLGTSIAFVGALIFVFLEPARRGVGYTVTTMGWRSSAARCWRRCGTERSEEGALRQWQTRHR